jgi:hypothetical protein
MRGSERAQGLRLMSEAWRACVRAWNRGMQIAQYELGELHYCLSREDAEPFFGLDRGAPCRLSEVSA